MIHLTLTPDARLTNDAVETLVQTLAVYESPLERMEGLKLREPPFFAWEMVLKRDDTRFVLTAPDHLESLVRKAVETTWPRVKAERCDDPFTRDPVKVYAVELNLHPMFAIRVDRREISFLSALLDVLSYLEPSEAVYIQVLCHPAPPDWHTSLDEAYRRFKEGDVPERFRFDRRRVIQTGVKAATSVALEALSIVTELLPFAEKPEPIRLSSERWKVFSGGELRTESRQKAKKDAVETTIRFALVTEPDRLPVLARMVSASFRELDGDNQLVARPVSLRNWEQMKQRKTGVRLSPDVLSIPEASRLMLLPTNPLQEKYHLARIEHLERSVPAILTKGGIPLGTVPYKERQLHVYMPTKNWDELCLPRIVIGGMGSGKTTFAANWMVESVRAGFGCISIDPAKGEIGNEVESVLPKSQVVRLRFGKDRFALDWREALRSPRGKSRMGQALTAFFASQDETQHLQTNRFLRSLALACETGSIQELLELCEDDKKREQAIQRMRDSIHLRTLKQFHASSTDRQRQILSPIYNRLDVLLGDEYLADCLEAEQGLDFVELMSEPRAVILDVPIKELGREAVDVLIHWLSSKIDLAMTLRPEEKQFPFFVILDEPHAFLRSEKVWKNCVVESRKYRVGYNFMFHSWEQIPRHLAEIIKAAGPHYHLYTSSKKTYQDLAEEIKPFTVEDALKTKRHYAINVIRAGGEVLSPFIAKMLAPPIRR